MTNADAVIIEAAINGITLPRTNPNVPRTSGQIAADALACFEAGAAIVHNHIDGAGLSGEEAAARYREAWDPILERRPDALLYPTVNPGPGGKPLLDHLEPLARSTTLRFAVVDPGSVNLGGAVDGVPTGGFVYANSFDDIAAAFALCDSLGLGPNIAVYEPGFLRVVVAWWRAERLPAGAFVKLYLSTDRGYMGAPFGLPPTPTALGAYLEILDGCPVPWAVSVVGGDAIASEVSRLALDAGGHLHVGLEFYGGDRTPTNRELVDEAVALCEKAGRPVASSTDAAEILGLPEPR
jgi:3-keto-5-aminohexanoate cleavage enzyme